MYLTHLLIFLFGPPSYFILKFKALYRIGNPFKIDNTVDKECQKDKQKIDKIQKIDQDQFKQQPALKSNLDL